MFKVFYAAAPYESAGIRLQRFVENIKNLPIKLKIAAYKISSPKGLNIDYTLDSLISPFNTSYRTQENENLSLYYDYVKNYKPDLIINDFDYYTSYISDYFDVPVWQCSPMLLYYAMTYGQKSRMNILSRHASIMDEQFNYSFAKHAIDNSNRKMVYSHFGDSDMCLDLNPGYEWIRPYHIVWKKRKSYLHNVIATTPSNPHIISFRKKFDDCVVYCNNHDLYFSDFIRPLDRKKYYYNLRNSRIIINEGYTSFLADTYYNNKFTVMSINLLDMESIVNCVVSEYMGNGKIIYENYNGDINEFRKKKILTCVNKNIKYLHEEIMSIL